MCDSGEHAELQRQESADSHNFQQGDKVKCLLEVDILRQMQEGHGGWNPKMAEVRRLPNKRAPLATLALVRKRLLLSFYTHKKS